jgi:hypothetical protein
VYSQVYNVEYFMFLNFKMQMRTSPTVKTALDYETIGRARLCLDEEAGNATFNNR